MIIFVFAAMLGAIGRYLANFYLPRHGILVVNMLGSCIAGIILGLILFLDLNPIIVQAVTGGFAGALTTFSTVAVTAAEQQINGRGSALKTWCLQVGLSTAAGLTGLFVTMLVFL